MDRRYRLMSALGVLCAGYNRKVKDMRKRTAHPRSIVARANHNHSLPMVAWWTSWPIL